MDRVDEWRVLVQRAPRRSPAAAWRAAEAETARVRERQPSSAAAWALEQQLALRRASP